VSEVLMALALVQWCQWSIEEL